MSESKAAKITHTGRTTRRDHEVVRAICLHHQPHGAHKISGVSPVSVDIEVPKNQILGTTTPDSGYLARDLSSDEFEAATRRFVIVRNAAHGIQSMSLAIYSR